GCFLPDLTRLASDTSAANLPPPISGLARQRASLSVSCQMQWTQRPIALHLGVQVRSVKSSRGRKSMEHSILGLCVAGAAAILLQTGSLGSVSNAVAAETCIKSNVMKHVKPCPVVQKKEAHHAMKKVPHHAKKKHASASVAAPKVTPT